MSSRVLFAGGALVRATRDAIEIRDPQTMALGHSIAIAASAMCRLRDGSVAALAGGNVLAELHQIDPTTGSVDTFSGFYASSMRFTLVPGQSPNRVRVAGEALVTYELGGKRLATITRRSLPDRHVDLFSGDQLTELDDGRLAYPGWKEIHVLDGDRWTAARVPGYELMHLAAAPNGRAWYTQYLSGKLALATLDDPARIETTIDFPGRKLVHIATFGETGAVVVGDDRDGRHRYSVAMFDTSGAVRWRRELSVPSGRYRLYTAISDTRIVVADATSSLLLAWDTATGDLLEPGVDRDAQ